MRNLLKYEGEYVEHLTTRRYCATRVVGQLLYIEEDAGRSSRKAVVKRDFGSKEQACAAAADAIADKLAQGYHRPHKKVEHRFDYAAALPMPMDVVVADPQDAPTTQRALEEDLGDLEVLAEPDEDYTKTITESLAELEARHSGK